jgi:2-amino-4-hydroxy-6-hydroxymethyldihydropteridine diphosphokinase
MRSSSIDPAQADAVVGMGSNLGDRLALLRAAAAHVARLATLVSRSGVYENPALGQPQPDFLNAAVRLRTELSAHELLNALLAIEHALGRTRGRERWAPRLIDLDLLWMQGVTLDEPGLTVPHPRLIERPFALVPLLDVAPDASDPRSGRRYDDLAQGLDCSALRRVREL